MNPAIRRIFTSNSLSRRFYFAARQAYRIHWLERSAERHFLNADVLKNVLRGQGGTGLVDLHTIDGLTITIRRNHGDAMTVSEIFTSNCYIRDLARPLPKNPIVIDVGGFIGDFALYAVKRLNARRVIVCEPSMKNWALLVKNIANNGYENRIQPVNKAVTNGRNIPMNIEAPDECQCMVSAYCASEEPMSTVPGTSLSDLLRDHAIETVDLLKIDCEGGEYEIIESTPGDVFRRIRNIVVEFHDPTRLESMKQRLRHEGYTLHTRAGIVTACRLREQPWN